MRNVIDIRYIRCDRVGDVGRTAARAVQQEKAWGVRRGDHVGAAVSRIGMALLVGCVAVLLIVGGLAVAYLVMLVAELWRGWRG